jgi:hypothetical protein
MTVASAERDGGFAERHRRVKAFRKPGVKRIGPVARRLISPRR